MKYKNYIFDLYGTLIDVKTDEHSLDLWKKMADIYACYGAVYKPKDMKRIFTRFEEEERVKVKNRTGCLVPEIKIEKVFIRLLVEAQGDNVRIPKNISTWAELISNTFRTLSREEIRLFPDTISTLKKLREKGCKVYLLSNAQAVFTRPEISLMKLDDCFDKIYISSYYGVMKPDKCFLRRLIKSEGLEKSETVYVGNDIGIDMKTAEENDIDAILLNNYDMSKREIKKQTEKAGLEHKFKTIDSIYKLISVTSLVNI